jgi:outer membrane protein assembly factor BamB
LDGKLRWQKKNGAAWQRSFPGARSSCTYDHGQLYHMNAHGRLVCLDAETGTREDENQQPAHLPAAAPLRGQGSFSSSQHWHSPGKLHDEIKNAMPRAFSCVRMPL